MFTANLRFPLFFAKSTSETIQEPLSKISHQIRTSTHLFQEFLDPTENRKRNLHKFPTGPSPTAPLGAHCRFYTFCIRDLRTGNYSNSQNRVSQRTAASYRRLFFDPFSGEICRANKHFDGQLALLGSLLSRTEQN